MIVGELETAIHAERVKEAADRENHRIFLLQYYFLLAPLLLWGWSGPKFYVNRFGFWDF